MTIRAFGRSAALVTALTLGVALTGGVHAAPAAAPAKAAVATPPDSRPAAIPVAVQIKIGRALLEEWDATDNLRTETYRDEITTAHAAPPAVPEQKAPAKG